jgi:hypothetical protein
MIKKKTLAAVILVMFFCASIASPSNNVIKDELFQRIGLL